MPNPLYAAALHYARRGWWCFPLQPHSKEPFKGTRGLLDATTDEKQIARWWSEYPDANVGIATGPSGLCCIDIDPRHGGDESWFALRKDQTVPETLTVLTAGGGYHYYFQRGHILAHNTAGDRGGLAAGVDTRALGGYLVAPPSVNGQGAWQWEIGHGPRDGILQPLPEWLIDKLTAKTNIVTLDLSRGEPVVEGEKSRHHFLVTVAGKFRRLGLSSGELVEAVHAVNKERCKPPKEKSEVIKICEWTARKPAAEPITYDDPANLGIMSYSDLRATSNPSEPWLIDALLRRSGLLLLAGPPGGGKSSLARNLARSVASGGLFMGRQCAQGEVLWVGLEEPNGELVDALEAMGCGDLPIRYRVEPFNGDQDRWLRAVVEQLRPTLAIIDTIGTFSNVENVNDYSQVARAMKPFLELRNKYGTSFLLNHHVNDGGGPLGSKYWRGAVDHILILDRKDNDTRLLNSTKMRGLDAVGLSTPLYLDHKTGIIAGCEVSHSTTEERDEEDLLMSYAGEKGLFG